jgi:hypothetical protein
VSGKESGEAKAWSSGPTAEIDAWPMVRVFFAAASELESGSNCFLSWDLTSRGTMKIISCVGPLYVLIICTGDSGDS